MPDTGLKLITSASVESNRLLRRYYTDERRHMDTEGMTALMSKCYPSNHNRRERIFPLQWSSYKKLSATQKEIIPTSFFLSHATRERGKKFFTIMKRKLRLHVNNRKSDLNSFRFICRSEDDFRRKFFYFKDTSSWGTNVSRHPHRSVSKTIKLRTQHVW